MIHRPISLAIAAAAALTISLSGSALAQQQFTPQQRREIQSVIRSYLVSHPEVLEEALQALQKQQADAQAAQHQATVKKYAAEIFNSPHQVVLGNPHGNATLVEFFDYNCPYCKHALADMLTLLKTDPKLKVVLKEFPVLGPGSVQAAEVAVAARMQDKSGKRYLDFHRRLLGERGRADRARALAAAKAAGFDVAKIEKDMKAPEVKATLQENFKLADALGLNGTPSYVIGTQVEVGAVGLNELRKDINMARCGKASC